MYTLSGTGRCGNALRAETIAILAGIALLEGGCGSSGSGGPPPSDSAMWVANGGGPPLPGGGPPPESSSSHGESAIKNKISEFQARQLIAGASVPVPVLINSSPDLSQPDGLIFDDNGNQWMTNCNAGTDSHGSVAEFRLATLKKLHTNPAPPADVVLSDDGSASILNCPGGLTFYAGNLWIAQTGGANNRQGFITEYLSNQIQSSGDPAPHITQTDTSEFISPSSVLFDQAGNLFVSDIGFSSYVGHVWVFTAAAVAAFIPGVNDTKSDAQLRDPTTTGPSPIAFDREGNLWVADCNANKTGELYMFPQSVLITGASSAATVFQSASIMTPNGAESSIDCPYGITFDKQGNLWYSNYSSALAYGAIAEFAQDQLSADGVSAPIPAIFLDSNANGSNIYQPVELAFGPSL